VELILPYIFVLYLILLHVHCVWLKRNSEERSIEERKRREKSQFLSFGMKRN